MPGSLPVELLDKILDDTSLDHADLARCCLASRDLFARARLQLYAGQILWINPSEDTSLASTRAWRSAIRSSPQAAALVRLVQLESYYATGHEGGAVDLVFDVLKRCTNLEHFIINTTRTPHSLLAGFCKCANLRTLWQVPLIKNTYNVLVDLPNLVRLALYFPGPPVVIDDIDPDLPAPSFHLETLSLAPVHDMPALGPVLAIVLRTSYASLRSLEACTAEYDFSDSAFSFLRPRNDGIEHFRTLARACDRITTVWLNEEVFDRWADRSNLMSSFEVLPATVKTLLVETFDTSGLHTLPTVAAVGKILDALPNGVRLERFGVTPLRYRPNSRPPPGVESSGSSSPDPDSSSSDSSSSSSSSDSSSNSSASDSNSTSSPSGSNSRSGSSSSWADSGSSFDSTRYMSEFWKGERKAWRKLEACCASRGIELVVCPRSILPRSVRVLRA